MILDILDIVALILCSISATLQVISAYMIGREQDYCVRLHCLTVSAMGGTLLCIVTLAFYALLKGLILRGLILLLTALTLYFVAAASSHILIRAYYRRKGVI